MGDIVIFFVLQNIAVFCVIFWVLTWGAEFFFSKKKYESTFQFYECGFKNISELNIQFTLNFSLLCVFLILYDIEFLLLYPIIFNYFLVSIVEFLCISFFIFLLIFCLIYDNKVNVLN